MPPRPSVSIPSGLDWMHEMGVSHTELAELAPMVPGSFTLPHAFYVNTATPKVFYRGTEEGTLPKTRGRWFQLPSDMTAKHPELARDPAPVARAVRLSR